MSANGQIVVIVHKTLSVKMKNKKGLSVAITAIVVIAISLVVLLIVLSFFTGGFGKSGQAMRDISSEAEEVGSDDVGEGITSNLKLWKKGINQTCAEDGDCGTLLVCHNSKCKGDTLYECTGNPDCKTNTCTNDLCT